jgi:DNA-binding MarR family transcriptional regulator
LAVGYLARHPSTKEAQMISSTERLIMSRLVRGPKHSRSFHVAKGIVAQLVSRGLVRRIAGEGNPRKNWIELTPEGIDLLEARHDR